MLGCCVAMARPNDHYRLVEHVHCESADQFIDAISPLGEHFRRFSTVESWVFRGHADDAYRLRPSAFRDDVVPTLHALARSDSSIADNPELNISQWLAEAALVRDFFVQADSSGLQLPEDSQVLRLSLSQTLDTLRFFAKPILEKTWEAIPRSLIWPPPQLLSLVALAQH